MIKKIIVTFAFSLLAISNSYSQISVKEEVTTDTVNLFTQYEQFSKSSKVAIFSSLLLPGTGHQYLGRPNSALAYLTIDIFSLAGAVFAERYSARVYSDARGYAAFYADAAGGGNDDRFWMYVGEFDDSKSYNLAIRNNRDFANEYNTGEKSWSWVTSDDRKKYNEMRKRARTYHLASSICIGAMVLNRIVSILDIRASTKYKVQKNVLNVKIEPSISSNFSSAGFLISTQF